MSNDTTTFGTVETEYGEPDAWDNWTVYATSGEYGVSAESAGHALLRFIDRHPDDFVHAVVCDGMQPRLVIEEPPVPASTSAAVVIEILDQYHDFDEVSREYTDTNPAVPIGATYRDTESGESFRITIEATKAE